MAYNSLLGYSKDGVAEVVASSKTLMSVIDHWALDAYRNLKFYSPTTGELKTWLEANAVRLPLTGTWVFNEKLTAANPPLRTDIAFTSNGTEFTNMNTGEGNFEPNKSYYLFYNDTKVNSDSAYTGNWVNSAYRTITFTQPVKYEGNEEFVRWFVDNATPPSDIMPGNYQFVLRPTGIPYLRNTDVSISFSSFGMQQNNDNPAYIDYNMISFKDTNGKPWMSWLGTTYYISRAYTWSAVDLTSDGSWYDQALRTITLKEPVKYADNPDFYNWFAENTISISKILPVGTYLLKNDNDIDTKGYNNKDLEGVIKFKSNNNIYSLMALLYMPGLLMYGETNVASGNIWRDQNYRTIETFYDQPVTEDFYNWFTQNVTTKQ